MQNNSLIYFPTKVYFGEKQYLKIGQIIKEYGFKNVLILYGKSHVKTSGLLDIILECLDKENIRYVLYGGIRTNPEINQVKEGLKIAKENNIDFILSIGGGSVIDTGKLISTSFYYDGDPFDISIHKYEPIKRIEHGVILTVCGSGSEMSNSCVIQDDKLGIKSGYSSDLNRPTFAICDPTLTYSVSNKQTAIGIIDTLMHTLERFLSKSDSEFETSDYLSIALLKNVIDVSYKIFDNPKDYQLRSALMLTSSFSHNGVASIAKDYVMPVHKLEHVISALYPEVSHGEGLSIMFIAWARYYMIYYVDKFALLLDKLFHLCLKSKYESAIMFINKLEEYFKSLNMPTRFKDLNIDVDVNQLVDKLFIGGIGQISHQDKPLDKDVARLIYQMAI